MSLYRHSIVFFILFIIKSSHSGELSESAIKNIGSGAAAMMECEKHGFIPIGATSDYLREIRKNLPSESSQMIVEQFQKSLHEMRIYSIIHKQWYKFNATASQCADIYKVYPSLLYHIKNINK